MILLISRVQNLFSFTFGLIYLYLGKKFTILENLKSFTLWRHWITVHIPWNHWHLHFAPISLCFYELMLFNGTTDICSMEPLVFMYCGALWSPFNVADSINTFWSMHYILSFIQRKAFKWNWSYKRWTSCLTFTVHSKKALIRENYNQGFMNGILHEI